MKDYLSDPVVSAFSTLLEEAARSNDANVQYFEEPAAGTLNRSTSRRHHMVFGRRGSGKSSLLRKTRTELTKDRRPIAFVDLEPFKGHQYPDLLLSVLINTFTSFLTWFDTAATTPATKKRFWHRLFGGRPNRGPLPKAGAELLKSQLARHVRDLNEQLHGPSSSEVEDITSGAVETAATSKMGGKLGGDSASLTVSRSRESSVSAKSQKTQRYREEKVEYLRRHVMDYQQLFDGMAEISGGDSYVLLDDLYHIRRTDQASVVDYLHSVAKGHKLWIKVGTIRHRSNWYIHGNPPVGVKLGDDADEINLDLTLEKYQTTKVFLTNILKRLASEAKVDLDLLVTDVALDRLILASGGVARDMLGILRRSIDVARERPNLASLPKIGAEDVNVAAGEYDSTKRDELKLDTYAEEQARLNAAFDQIRKFCIEKAETNCFLIPQDAKGHLVDAINELVDLKLLHRIRSRVTVNTATQRGQIFQAFMLDLSQYAGTRKRRNLDVIEFWKSGADNKLRRASLILETGE